LRNGISKAPSGKLVTYLPIEQPTDHHCVTTREKNLPNTELHFTFSG